MLSQSPRAPGATTNIGALLFDVELGAVSESDSLSRLEDDMAVEELPPCPSLADDQSRAYPRNRVSLRHSGHSQ
jgi:hypothetical protein